MPTPPAPAHATAAAAPDAELSALGKCCRLLEALTDVQRRRLLRFLAEKYGACDDTAEAAEALRAARSAAGA